MSKEMSVLVPDLGSDDAFPIVDVFVKEGDHLEADAPILMLESDKASMEVPAPAAGVVLTLKVKVGDEVKSGDTIATLKTDAVDATSDNTDNAETAKTATPSPAKAAESTSSNAGAYDCDMLVIGAGPGGYSAAFRSADLGMKTVLVERFSNLGGVCLNVGCIPSKALLHTAHILEEATALKAHGVAFTKPKINIDEVRAHKDSVVARLTKGIAGMAKMRQVKTVTGVATFTSANAVEVIKDDGKKETITFQKAIIAVGSSVIHLPFMPDDERVIDSTGALALSDVPKTMLVIGGGIIGMEMATVYSSFGAEVSVVELSDSLMPGADADLVRIWLKENKDRFKDVFLSTKVTDAKATKKGIEVTFSGKTEETKTYDKVLVAIGRSPNGKKVAAENAGVNVDERGFIAVDEQMRTNVPHIFAIGDVVGQPMLAHKAVHEAHVAAEVAAGEKSYFDAKVIPSVAYTTPEVAFVGLTEAEAKAKGIAYEKASFPWAASGKAIANNADAGMTKLIFDKKTHRVLGGGIVGINAGDLIAEVALAIEMGADATDIAKTIHPHPTLSESIGMTAEAFEGTCTDLPPQKK